jgi:hypothetical protein
VWIRTWPIVPWTGPKASLKLYLFPKRVQPLL